jgi:hypothetical protein
LVSFDSGQLKLAFSKKIRASYLHFLDSLPSFWSGKGAR